MRLRPLGDRVILQRVASEAKTKGGIIIPDSAQEKPIEGKIIAVGPGQRGDDGERLKPTVKAGNKVLFAKYSGSEVKIEGEEYLITREEDILVIIS